MQPLLTNVQLYKIHQQNIELLENEMALIKDSALTNIGKLESLKEQYSTKENSSSLDGQIKKSEIDVLSATRLYTMLLCAWLENRLKVILYEPSCAAFTDTERASIKNVREMNKKWKICFNLALLKGCGITYTGSITDLSQKQNSLFVGHTSVLSTYDILFDYLEMIKGAIEVRNRLAHGEWDIQLNSAGTKLSEGACSDFISNFDNILKLDRVFAMFKEIAELINLYVVFKEREGGRQSDFIVLRDQHIKKIKHIKIEIETKSFEKYCLQQKRRHDNLRARQKQIALLNSNS